MIAAPYTNVLSGSLGTRLQWEKWHRCPCTGHEGAARRDCPICNGEGGIFDPPSAIFRAGLTGVSAKQLENLRTKLGPGLIGDASVSIPANAPAYGLVTGGDRFLAVDALDPFEWVLTPNTPVRLPSGAVAGSVFGLTTGGLALIPISLPAAGADGRIVVTQNTVIRMRAPRRFQVVADIGRLRSWIPGLPEPFLLKQIDLTTR
jgi:hypothetical protein